MPTPPFDRSLALACRLETFRAHWIEVQCCRGIQHLPVRLVLAAEPKRGGRTLADSLIRSRCQACRARPASALLIDSVAGRAGRGRGRSGVAAAPGARWVLRLWPVSRVVNSVRNDGANLLDPPAPPASDISCRAELGLTARLHFVLRVQFGMPTPPFDLALEIACPEDLLCAVDRAVVLPRYPATTDTHAEHGRSRVATGRGAKRMVYPWGSRFGVEHSVKVVACTGNGRNPTV
jgi:hypothetical protein